MRGAAAHVRGRFCARPNPIVNFFIIHHLPPKRGKAAKFYKIVAFIYYLYKNRAEYRPGGWKRGEPGGIIKKAGRTACGS